MTDNVVIELDAVRKYSNNPEYHIVNRARCEEFDLEVSGHGRVITRLAHLLAENKCQISRGLEVRRGDTLCFVVKPLDLWVNPVDKRPEHLKGKPNEQ